ncbi:MAG: ArsR family transcriptional regulator [Clostridiales bacterium]|nr:ArsR family transcriptional regulator [Clostridiales bacterium]
MLLYVSQENLSFFKALASEVRVEVINLLADGDMNIKELAEAVGISSPIMLKHVRKLEDAGIIKTKMISRNGAVSKMCTLLVTEYRLQLPYRKMNMRDSHEIHIPVGHYTDFEVHPTCGLASETENIGQMDDPRYFLEPQRVNAECIWFTTGFVEYSIPNYLVANQQIEEVEISFEISSEAPGFNDEWPSDIRFSLNGTYLCEWTSPGDFGERHGVLTPQWWTGNQYGLLKTLRISGRGTFLDGERVSSVTLNEAVDVTAQRWILRFEVLPTAKNAGGLTLFGSKFGNYGQDILVRTFYTKKD